MKKIDVLLATYNGEKYIAEQIESILLNFQKVTEYDCRLLISDDGSTDDTIQIINNISKLDNRIILVNTTKKGGVKENFNGLINSSSADYIFFCDQDDFWLPAKMRMFIDRFISIEKEYAGPILIHSDLCVTNGYLSPQSESMFKYQNINANPSFNELIVSNSVTGCVMACNKTLLNIARESTIIESIMHDWYLALIAKAFGRIDFIDSSLILYRQHGGNQVGAKPFNLSAILSIYKIHDNYIKAKSSIVKTQDQARLFLNDFSDKIERNNASLLLQFSSPKDVNIFKRLSLFLNNDFKKKGFIRNIVFFYIFVIKAL
ncbi:TPA: glycosyltransferase family 2 protein [Klebsiella variicola]